MTVETGVLERYSAGAESIQADLCCPVDYDRELLALLPQEIIDKEKELINKKSGFYKKTGDNLKEMKALLVEKMSLPGPRIRSPLDDT